MLDHIRRLFDHAAWADTRAIESLQGAPGADPHALQVLAHILGAEEVWLARLEGREANEPVWPQLDLDACVALARENRARYGRYLETLQPADLHRSIHYQNSAGVSFESKVIDILTHVALHGSYHRGQVALSVRRAGAAPLFTDYIAFVRGGAPATKDLEPALASRGPGLTDRSTA